MASDTQKEKSATEGAAKAPKPGDHAAFEEVVRQETPRLYRVIYRLVKDQSEAESLVQETFLQAYQNLDNFRGDSAFSTWLIGIGLNLARSSLRKRKREDVLSEEDIEELQPAFRMGRYAEKPRAWKPHRRLEQREKERVLREALERLPDSYRTVIVLRDLEELSTAETAEALDITRGNVRVRLHRARQALRAILEEHFEEEDL